MSRELDAGLHFFFLLAGLILFLRGYRQFPHYLKLVGGYLLVTFIADLAAVSIMFNRSLAEWFGNNLFIYHFLTPVQYACIALIYYHLFTNPVKKKLLSVLSFCSYSFPSCSHFFSRASMTIIPMHPCFGIF
jgi:hypothetical protein